MRIQLAKHSGPHVTGVCSSSNLELVKSLGADEAVDCTRDDFSKAGRVHDIVFDTAGRSAFLAPSEIPSARRFLRSRRASWGTVVDSWREFFEGCGLPSRALQKSLAEWPAAPPGISLFGKGSSRPKGKGP
jgi:hypothetical protein